MSSGKTKIVEVSYRRMWVLAGMVVLMFCLSMLCSDARALYSISNTGSDHVYGLSGINARWATGPDFGTVSAEATNNDAYGLFNNSGDVEIVGDFGLAGHISATSGDEHAYGLFTDTGNIRTEAINGTIEATSGWYRAVGLFAENGSIHTGDIGGTITIEAWGSSAFGLRSDNSLSSIVTGDITGDITVTSGGDRAYGFRSDGSIHTGDITGSITATATGENTADGDYAYGLSSGTDMTTGAISGTITATADNDYAYGLASGGSLTTGEIDGTITATATNGSYAYGLYSSGDMTVGNIGSGVSVITATAGDSYAYGLYSNGILTTGDIDSTIIATAGVDEAAGLYSSGGSITTGAINGTITATAGGDEEDGDSAYGLYASNSITTGVINGIISAEMTNGSGAYGMYAGVDITTGYIGYHYYVYDDTQITATAGTDNAYGLYAGHDLTVGNIGYNYGYGGYGDTQITATATGGSNAYGLYAGHDLHVGNIGSNYGYEYEYEYEYYGGYGDTLIAATAGTDNAYGLYAGHDLTVGNIGYNYADAYEYGGYGDTQITATAGGSNAYGLYAGNDLTVGDIGINEGYGYGDTQITATAGGSNAYGLYAGNHLTVGDIGYDATISATAGIDNAYGLYASYITTGNIGGEIMAHADGNNAFGMSAGEIDTGTISGTVSASAGVNGAYGLSAMGVYTGDITGTISADAGRDNAYGINAIEIETGDITGAISATADNNNAYGLSADSITTGDIGSDAEITATAANDNASGMSAATITTGAINGTITATTTNGANATGIGASTLTTGAINGTITATAGTSHAVGLWGGSMETGNITGTITAHAGTDNAFGLYTDGGSLTTGEISGTVSAHADGNFAYGILAYGPMNVTINGGSISATAGGGANVAAIQSGRIGGGGLLETQNANDTVEIVAGSTIHGDINLAGTSDNDLLTLSGYNCDSTTFGTDVNIDNVETINITGGTWHINGVVNNNANGTTVNGGILEGTGTLGNLFVNDGGTLNPGNSIGTINVANLTIGSGGTYEVEVNDSGKADKVNVSGTADLEDGTIRGVALERLSRDNPFSVVVIDAPDDGLNDTAFATIAGNKLFLEFSVDYDYGAGDVTLNVDPLSYATYARTGNERSIGHALDNLVNTGQDTGDMDTVISFFDDLNPGEEAQANAAMDQMMPQDALGLPEVTRNMMNQFSESVLDHTGSVRGSKQYAMMDGSRYLLASTSNSPVTTPEVDKWLPYAKGLGTWGTRDGKTDIVGYNYNTYGVMGGVDKLVSEDTLIGFGIGGSRTSVDYKQAGTSADIDSILVSLYGSYFKDDWHVDLTLGYSHNSYDSQRGIHFGDIDREAKSDHQGNAYNIAMEFGNNFGGTSMLLEPVVGVGYTSVQEGSYKEKGADSLNLKVDPKTMEGIYSKLGLRLAKEFRCEKNPDMVWVPKANVFWIHDFADGAKFSNEFIDGGSFTTQSQDPVRDAFNIGAGLNVYFTKSVRLFADYGWQTAGSFNSNTVQAGLQWAF